jgi:hypothetical protein
MKSKLFFFVFFFGVFGFMLNESRAQLDIPSHSPAGKLEQMVGYTLITVEYDRPSMHGAVIFGGNIPYNELWNMAIKDPAIITFSDPVTIEGHPIEAGKYVISAIPGEEEWTVIFEDAKYLGRLVNPHTYKESLRVKVYPGFLDCHFETFTIDIGEITQSTATLTFIWENTIVKLNIGTEADQEALAKIDAALRDPMAKLGDTYFAAAAYYLDNHKDIDQALIWIDKAVKFNGEIDTYIFLKARIFGEIGNYKKAIDFGEQALEIAQRNKHKAFMMRIEATIEKWRNLSNH